MQTTLKPNIEIGMRDLFAGNAKDELLSNALYDLFNPDEAESRELGQLNFDQILNALDQLRSQEFIDDSASLNIPDIEATVKIVNEFYERLTDGEFIRLESRDKFIFSYSLFLKMLFSCLYFPEEYDHTWGVLVEQVQQENQLSKTESYRSSQLDFVAQVKDKMVENFIRANLTIAEVIASVGEQQRAKVEETLSGIDNESLWVDIEKLLNDIRSTKETLSVGTKSVDFKTAGFLFGVTSGAIKTLVSEKLSDTEFVDSLVSQLYRAFPDSYEDFDLEILRALNLLTEEQLALFNSEYRPRFAPREKKSAAMNLIFMDDHVLVHRVRQAILESEGRYVGPEYLDTIFFKKLAYSPYSRIVPIQTTDTTPVALSAEQAQIYGVNFSNPGKDYIRMEHQKLFYDQTRRDLEELNRRIDYCIKNGVELVVFVPTCPADTHSLTSKNEVEFTKRAIVGRAVSWTCLNTTDGLAPLLKKLAEIPELKVRTVYATGDMEYLSGNSRGMNYEDFMAALNENHQQIAQLVTLRLGGRLDQVLCEETDELLSARIAVGLIEGKVNIDVDGIVNLAQRNQVDWQELKSELTPIIDDFFYDQSNNIEIEKTITARSQYYRMRISLAEGINEEMVDELITDERLKQELKIDLVDYCAFHTLAQKLWGRDRMFILAGDSHPLESLAAKISGNFLISVEGNYKGSKFLEVPQLNTAIV